MKFSPARFLGKTIGPVALAAGCFAGLYYYSHTNIVVQTHSGMRRIHPGAVLGKTMIDLKNGTRRVIQQDARPTLLILLSGSECPACLDEARMWEQLACMPRTLRVIAVFVGTTDVDIQTYLRLNKPPYEVYRFADAANEGALGEDYARPVKVLLDRWGLVRYTAGPSNDIAAQRNIEARIEAFTANGRE